MCLLTGFVWEKLLCSDARWIAKVMQKLISLLGNALGPSGVSNTKIRWSWLAFGIQLAAKEVVLATCKGNKMEIRSLGMPITAAQRRSHRETPDSSFYQTYQTAFATQQQSSGAASTASSLSSSTALESILGQTHTELSAMRGVSEECQTTYANLLNRAYSSGGIGNARQFLSGLSATELDAVRQNHCLANPINVAALSEEGAENLLLPEGYSVDLNQDGVDEVGEGKTICVPPKAAPVAFKEAWYQATADMDEGMAMTYGLTIHGAIYGIPMDGQPGAPLRAPDQLETYQSLVRDYLASLDEHKGMLAEGQYERDKAFFSKLQSLLS